MKDKRFLVVDDDGPVAEFVRTVIELEGGTAVLAPTAASALESCRTCAPFDVMVVDLGLPDVSGWDLMESAQNLQPACKVVIFSAQSKESYAERAGPAGVALSLVKPVAAATLRDALRSVLRPPLAP